MNPLRVLIAASALITAVAAAAEAHEYRIDAVAVDHPWSRPAAAGMTGAGYMVIRNSGKAPVVITGASSPLAGKVTIHQTSVAGGVMRMTPQGAGLTVPAGASIVLAPAGYHLMLEGLKKPLTVGQHVPLTLKFANGNTLNVQLAVEAGPAGGGAAMRPMAGMNH